MSELRAAAEDTLRESAGLLLQEFGFHSSGTARRACMLAESYLAEHPADDAEPVTEEWLLSVGFKRHPFEGMLHVIDGWMSMSIGQHEKNAFVNTPLRGKTRGDVRTLCRSLGIELKEGE